MVLAHYAGAPLTIDRPLPGGDCSGLQTRVPFVHKWRESASVMPAGWYGAPTPLDVAPGIGCAPNLGRDCYVCARKVGSGYTEGHRVPMRGDIACMRIGVCSSSWPAIRGR
jgi:hypothetical protein